MYLAIKNLFQFDETQVLVAGVAKMIFDCCYEGYCGPSYFENFILLPNYLIGP